VPRVGLFSLVVAVLAAGCGGVATSREGADAQSGKQLFAQKCGQCHVMSDAGTRGQLGPNLDNAFGYARAQDFDESTFFEITLDQMRIPAPPMPDFDEPGTENTLQEEQLVDVAHYVARCAGVQFREQKPADCVGPPEGAQAVFVSSCGSCHVLAEAGTQGTTGPNLDESKPGLEEAIAQIANGGGGMPAFKDQLTDEQIREIAQYIVESTGGS
jgi:cbb3-type cytochrome c oxidase subunit III